MNKGIGQLKEAMNISRQKLEIHCLIFSCEEKKYSQILVGHSRKYLHDPQSVQLKKWCMYFSRSLF